MLLCKLVKKPNSKPTTFWSFSFFSSLSSRLSLSVSPPLFPFPLLPSVELLQILIFDVCVCKYVSKWSLKLGHGSSYMEEQKLDPQTPLSVSDIVHWLTSAHSNLWQKHNTSNHVVAFREAMFTSNISGMEKMSWQWFWLWDGCGFIETGSRLIFIFSLTVWVSLFFELVASCSRTRLTRVWFSAVVAHQPQVSSFW